MLSALQALKKSGKDHRGIAHLERACRQLAEEGVPTAGRLSTAKARIVRKEWKDTMRDITSQPHEAIAHMAEKADEAARKEIGQEMGRKRKEYAKWIATAVKEAPGALHRITKQKDRYEDEYVAKQKASSPKDRIDAKRKEFSNLWQASRIEEQPVLQELIEDLREQAKQIERAVLKAMRGAAMQRQQAVRVASRLPCAWLP